MRVIIKKTMAFTSTLSNTFMMYIHAQITQII